MVKKSTTCTTDYQLNLRAASNAVLVFVKHPTPGKVKTRLAATVGADQAARLYRVWVGIILAKLQDLRPETSLIAYFTGGDVASFSEWHDLVDDWLPQPDGDLGNRLDFGFRWCCQSYDRVAAIGTDCLEIDSTSVNKAFSKLDICDIVVGPSTDGGYYLLGCARYLPGCFDSIRWSTEHTLADQLRNCQQNAWKAQLLPEKSDIDTWEDWLRYQERQAKTKP